jgi:MmyB-like transcription regulator ligand binding domain
LGREGLPARLNHPLVGQLTFRCETMELADQGLYLIACGAVPGSRDADALNLLAGWNGTDNGETWRSRRPELALKPPRATSGAYRNRRVTNHPRPVSSDRREPRTAADIFSRAARGPAGRIPRAVTAGRARHRRVRLRILLKRLQAVDVRGPDHRVAALTATSRRDTNAQG